MNLTGVEKVVFLAIYNLRYFDDFSTQQALNDIAFAYPNEIAMLQSYNLITLDNDNIPDLTSAGIELAKNLAREIQQSLVEKSPPKKSYPWHKNKSKTFLTGRCCHDR